MKQTGGFGPRFNTEKNMTQAKSEAKPETKPQAKSEAKPERVALVSMSNGTDTIEVNPLCVQDHERMGWKRAAPAAE